MADRGEGYAALQRTLWGFARHPNFAGVLLIGLGCEVNQIDFLLEAYDIKPGPHFRTMTMQETGGTRKTIERAIEMLTEMLPDADHFSTRPSGVDSSGTHPKTRSVLSIPSDKKQRVGASTILQYFAFNNAEPRNFLRRG